MQKTQLNVFKSMFLIRISNNLLNYKIDQINQISILSFYFFHFLPQNISARSFFPFPSAIYFRITYLSYAASAGDLPLKCRTFHYGPSAGQYAATFTVVYFKGHFVRKLVEIQCIRNIRSVPGYIKEVAEGEKRCVVMFNFVCMFF